MEDVRRKYVPPAIDETAFNCPHCGALAKQFWFSMHADDFKKDNTPKLFDAEEVARISELDIKDPDKKKEFIERAERLAEQRPFIVSNYVTRGHDVGNVFLSQCFNCNEISIWIYNRLHWPQRGEAPLPNRDIPGDIQADYDEASTILDLSPRGAAALLRLAIQKLCEYLGEKGDLNHNIGELVKKGLDVKIKEALDVVRVIGNNAVHPGQIDLKDNRPIAEKLFDLVNLIADAMISQPEHVKAMFAALPETARKAIEERNGIAAGAEAAPPDPAAEEKPAPETAKDVTDDGERESS